MEKRRAPSRPPALPPAPAHPEGITGYGKGKGMPRQPVPSAPRPASTQELAVQGLTAARGTAALHGIGVAGMPRARARGNAQLHQHQAPSL